MTAEQTADRLAGADTTPAAVFVAEVIVPATAWPARLTVSPTVPLTAPTVPATVFATPLTVDPAADPPLATVPGDGAARRPERRSPTGPVAVPPPQLEPHDGGEEAGGVEVTVAVRRPPVPPVPPRPVPPRLCRPSRPVSVGATRRGSEPGRLRTVPGARPPTTPRDAVRRRAGLPTGAVTTGAALAAAAPRRA